MCFAIDQCYVYEFWRGMYLGLFDGKLSRRIAPHCCEVLFLTREAPMAVIGLDDCLCPHIEQSYEDGVLRASFIKKGETMYLVSRQPAVSARGCRCEKISSGGGNLFRLVYDGEMDFTVK